MAVFFFFFLMVWGLANSTKPVDMAKFQCLSLPEAKRWNSFLSALVIWIDIILKWRDVVITLFPLDGHLAVLKLRSAGLFVLETQSSSCESSVSSLACMQTQFDHPWPDESRDSNGQIAFPCLY